MMKQILSRVLAALFLAGVLGTSLTACNTTEGFGKDVQRGGRAIERESQERR